MNILFVCTANRDRSRTAEVYFQNKYPEHNIRSCGVNKYACEKYGGVPVQRYMLDFADRIICMEHLHAFYITQKIDKRYLDKIEVLRLEDIYTFMSKELIDELQLLEDVILL
jgi:predicted protein tyrosine phosphatase